MAMTREDIRAELLDDIKTSLDVTWTDEDNDDKYVILIASSIAYLEKMAGQELDFKEDGPPLELLRERVRYARDNALDVFENNYRHEILALQNGKKVERYDNSQASLSAE